MSKKLPCILFSLLCVFNVFVCNATCLSISDLGEIQVLDKREIPNDLNLEINSTCSKHKFFLQAAAQEDGTFAIYTRGKTEDDKWFDLKSVFIDVFDKNGNFLKEIELQTSQDVAIEINNSMINIYLYSAVIQYNILTEETEYLLIPDDAVNKSGILKKLRAKEFTVGEWNFSYEECREGYTKLIRSKDGVTEELLALEGTNNSFVNPITITSFILFCFWLGYKLKKRTSE